MQYLGSGSGYWMILCRGAKRLTPALRSYIDMDYRACRTVKRLHLVSFADYRGYHRGQSQQTFTTNGWSTLHISISNSLRCRAIACTAYRLGLLRDVGLIPSTNKTNQYRSISIQHDDDDFDFPPLDLLTPSLTIPLPPNMRKEKPTQVNDGYHHQDIRTGVGPNNDLKVFTPVYITEGSSFPNKAIENTKTQMEGRASRRGKRGQQSRIRSQLRRHLRHQEERKHRFTQIRQQCEDHEDVVPPDDASIRGPTAEQQRHDREGDHGEKGADRPAESSGDPGDVEIFFKTLPINKQSPYIIMMATNCVDGFDVHRVYPYSAFIANRKLAGGGWAKDITVTKDLILQEILRRNPTAKPNASKRKIADLTLFLKPMTDPRDVAFVAAKESEFRQKMLNVLAECEATNRRIGGVDDVEGRDQHLQSNGSLTMNVATINVAEKVMDNAECIALSQRCLLVHRLPLDTLPEHILEMFLAHSSIRPKNVPDIDFTGVYGKCQVEFASSQHAELAYATLAVEEHADSAGRMQKRVGRERVGSGVGGHIWIRKAR